MADHAHNVYLQLLRALVFWGFGLFYCWRCLCWFMFGGPWMDSFPRVAGQLLLIYTLIQGFLDLSLLHWPVTLVFTGVLLGIPLSWHRTSGRQLTQI